MSTRQLIEGALVIDLETTIGRDSEEKPSPMPWHGGSAVALGAASKVLSATPTYAVEYDIHQEGPITSAMDDVLKSAAGINDPEDGPRLLVGHNIKFDLHHMLAGKSSAEIRDVCGTINIWDTMTAEYYLSGQEHGMISLENACKRRGMPLVKDERVSGVFKAGFGANYVDKDLLLEYLEADVRSTSVLYARQIEQALADGGVEYVMYLISLMGAQLATIQAEHAGMYVRREKILVEGERLRARVKELDSWLTNFMRRWAPSDVSTPTIGPSSNPAVGNVLCGGVWKVKCPETLLDEDGLPLRYKTGTRAGEIKTRQAIKVTEIVGCLPRDIAAEYKYRGVDDKTLSDILSKTRGVPGGMEVCGFIETLLEYRKLSKDLNTYHDGLLKHIGDDSIIRPKYNHAIAKTKRLTSSSPNAQNISNKDTGGKT